MTYSEIFFGWFVQKVCLGDDCRILAQGLVRDLFGGLCKWLVGGLVHVVYLDVLFKGHVQVAFSKDFFGCFIQIICLIGSLRLFLVNE